MHETVPSTVASAQPDYSQKISVSEWETRVDLAACYQIVALMGWDDLIYTHISARIPGTDEFLINPYGLLFDEITASNLVKVDFKCRKIEDSPHEVNPAGFLLHSSIHEARPDVGCALHLHTDYGIAVSIQKNGLQLLSQTAGIIYPHIGYHDYEGILVREAEKERLKKSIQTHNALLLKNHGTVTVGKDIPTAFMRMYFLEKACQYQILAQSTGSELNTMSSEAYQNMQTTLEKPLGKSSPWTALKRKLDRLSLPYKH